MAKVSISAKIETDIIKKLDNKAKAKGFSRSKYIAKILKDHALNLGGAGQSLMRFGKALDCPIFILPSNPKSAWVDISVCDTCPKTIHNKPCPSWEEHQSALRVEYIMKPVKKKKGVNKKHG